MLPKLMAILGVLASDRSTNPETSPIAAERGYHLAGRRSSQLSGVGLLLLVVVGGLVLLPVGAARGDSLPTVAVPGQPYTTIGPDGQIIVHPPRAVANRIIVGLRPGVGPQQVQPLAERAGGQPLSLSPDGAIMVVALDESTGLEEAIAAYQSQPEVKFATYDLLVYPALTPNDPDLLEQYHHMLCNSMDAWDVTTGSASVTIAVIDSGIDPDHPDLSAKLWINSGEIADNGIDDDENGYIDDVNGWDFINSSNDIEPEPDGNDDDSNGFVDDNVNHGTFVSGLAAAMTNNGYGIAGVDWNARIMMLQVFPDDGAGTVSTMIEAIYYAVDNGADVINMSLSGSYTTAYDPAINYAYINGVLVVAAAGNSDVEFTDDSATWESPVCNDGPNPYVNNYVLGVAATDENDERAIFSNYDGSTANFVDVSAPGVDVYSTRYYNVGFPQFSEYFGTGSGTSFSAPLAAGLAALLLASQPDRTPADLIAKIREGADDIDALNPLYAGKLGTGRINMAGALEDITPPEITIVTPPNNSTTVYTDIAIYATIVDPESGVDEITVELEIDGTPIVGFDYDAGELTYDATLTEGLHEIIVRASDNAGNDGEAVSNFRILAKSFDAGLHLFSLPYTYNPGQFPTPASLFGLSPSDVAMHRWWPGDSNSNKYRTYADNYGTFNPPDAMGGDPVVDSPPAGLGYFIYLAQEAEIEQPGIALDGGSSSYEIDLTYGTVPPRGWNMIGCPFTSALNWGSIQFITGGETQSITEAVADGVTDGILWEFVSTGSGGYYDFPANPFTAALEPFKGYWVHVWEDTTLRLYAPSLAGVATTSAAGSDALAGNEGWQMQLIARAGGDIDPSNYIGVSSRATAGYDPGLDVTEPPSVGSAVQCYQPRGDWDQYAGRYARDIQAAGSGTQTWDIEVVCELSQAPVKLTWPRLNAVVPDGTKLMLEDLDGGQQVYMRTVSGYSFTSQEGGDVRHLRIIAYDDSASSLTLTGVSAQTMTASRGVVITYDLSKPATVSAEICNISGVVIKRLGERSSSGTEVEMVLWDGRSDQGTRVPSGRYLARVTARAADGQTVQAVRPFAILP